MNKRQRKKNRIGEFTRYGFEFLVLLHNRSDFEPFCAAFIEFVEAHKLFFGGGMDPRNASLLSGYITAGPGTCTEADRALVEAWLLRHPGMDDVWMGLLETVE